MNEQLHLLFARFIALAQRRAMPEISNPRELHGLQIAAMARLVKRGVVWMVPSQSGGRQRGLA